MENLSLNSPKPGASRGPHKAGTAAAAQLFSWTAQYTQLQGQAQQLEVACSSAHSQDTGRDARVQAGALHQLRLQLAKQVQSALVQLEGIKDAVRQPGTVPLQGLEKRLAQFEGSLSSLQTQCAEQLARLAQREAEATTELEAASRGLQALLEAPTPADPTPNGAPAPAKAAATPRQPTKAAPALLDLPPKVRECDEFMQRHGPTGGWHPEDHAEFERILKSCRGVYSHVVQISAEQLGLLHSREDIIRHARWHEELQELQAQKRLAIQQWRLQRAAKQAELLRQEVEQAPPPPTQVDQKSLAQLQKQREQQARAVMEWKRSREEQQQKQRQREQEEVRRRQEHERQARQARQQQLAAAVAEYRQRKVEQYQERALAADSNPGSRLPTPDPEAQRRAAERSQQLLARRQGLLQRRASHAQEQQARLQQLQQEASAAFSGIERDPGRVLQPTATAAQRQLVTTTEERGDKGSGWIRHVQHKAMPSWCG